MLCLSLYAKDANELLKKAVRTEISEIRLDLSELDADAIQELFSKGLQLIACCRQYAVPNDKKRLRQLRQALEAGAQYIDLDMESDGMLYDQLYDLIKEKGANLILSYHNFEHTPAYEELCDLVDKAHKKQADMVKVACMANGKEDVVRIMSLYACYPRIIAFAMGEFGAFTRPLSYKMGAPVVYVAEDEAHRTAPGQYTLEEMKNSIQLLK